MQKRNYKVHGTEDGLKELKFASKLSKTKKHSSKNRTRESTITIGKYDYKVLNANALSRRKMQNCCIIHGACSFCFVRIVQFGISRSKCVCVAEHKEMVLCVHSCSMTLFRTMRPRHKSMKSISHI